MAELRKTLGREVPLSGTERHSTRDVKPCCVRLKLTGKGSLSRVLIFGLKALNNIEAGIETPVLEVEVLTQGIHVAGRVPAAKATH